MKMYVPMLCELGPIEDADWNEEKYYLHSTEVFGEVNFFDTIEDAKDHITSHLKNSGVKDTYFEKEAVLDFKPASVVSGPYLVWNESKSCAFGPFLVLEVEW